VKETAVQTPRSVKKEGEEVSRLWSRDSSAAHGEDHGEAGCPSAAHGGSLWSRYQPMTPFYTQSLSEGLPFSWFCYS